MTFARVLLAAVLTLLAGAVPTAQPPAPPTTVHRFNAPLRAGTAPLTQAPDGRLFGIFEQGGPRDMGAVYVLTPDGAGGYAFSLLHQFDGADGQNPTGLTYSAVDDKLYGTTSGGGVSGPLIDGMGTVFAMDSTGGGFTKLIDFDLDFSVPQPGHPAAGLLEASDGNFYGTGSTASTFPGSGAIFKCLVQRGPGLRGEQLRVRAPERPAVAAFSVQPRAVVFSRRVTAIRRPADTPAECSTSSAVTGAASGVRSGLIRQGRATS